MASSNKKRMRDIRLINEMEKIDKTYTKEEAAKIVLEKVMNNNGITKKDKALIKMTIDGLLNEIARLNEIIDYLKSKGE